MKNKTIVSSSIYFHIKLTCCLAYSIRGKGSSHSLSNSPKTNAPPKYFFNLICAKTFMKLHINPAKQINLSEKLSFPFSLR